MKHVLYKMVFALAVLVFYTQAYAVPTAKVTYKVVSDSGEPIEGATVMVGFRPYIGGNPNPTIEKGLSNSDGLFSASGSTQHSVSASIRKEGYYNSSNTFGGNQFTSVKGIMGFRRWEPWNPKIEVLLKKIKNPIALYMRDIRQLSKEYKFNLVLPAFKAGFDLIESDWVTPYGSGSIADIIFQLVKNHESDDSFEDELIITFSNPNDGIQPYRTPKSNSSTFRMPYHAPINNYQQALSKTFLNKPDKIFRSPFHWDMNYFIRVRTEVDNEGNITSANYGKIEGDIEFGAPLKIETAWLKFKYFFNPTPNDTNLEFDENRNLFGRENVE